MKKIMTVLLLLCAAVNGQADDGKGNLAVIKGAPLTVPE